MKQTSTLLCLLLLCSLINGQTKLELVQFSSGYSAPVDITNCGDSRLFVVEQKGKIWICDSTGTRSAKSYLNITDKVLFDGEQGLLGLAFDPKYATNGFLYVYYINLKGKAQISRFKRGSTDPNAAT